MTQSKPKCSLLITLMFHIISIQVDQNKDGLSHFVQYWHTLTKTLFRKETDVLNNSHKIRFEALSRLQEKKTLNI